jgi:hypothetical protein
MYSDGSLLEYKERGYGVWTTASPGTMNAQSASRGEDLRGDEWGPGRVEVYDGGRRGWRGRQKRIEIRDLAWRDRKYPLLRRQHGAGSDIRPPQAAAG